jgi:hypothetical protein
MKKSEQDKQNIPLDDDILEGKKDVLRAKDIIPAAPIAEQEDSPALPATVSEETTDKDVDEKTTLEKKDTGVLQFNLAEKIMTEQRKISAIRRKAPTQKDEPHKKVKPRSKRYIFNQTTLTTDEENKLIAQIVARDIKKLCRDS